MNPALPICHPLSHSALDLPPVRVENAQGAYLYAKDGRKIADTVLLGDLHRCRNPRIAAAQRQNRTMDELRRACDTISGSQGDTVLRQMVC